MYTIAVIVVLYFYVRLGMWVARKAAIRCKRKRIKWGVRIAVALVFILIPTGDEIAGRIYFNYLCKTEAGTKVYQTIELPAEYWDENGQPMFMNSRGVLDMELLGNRLEWRRKKTLYVKYLINIERDQWILYDKHAQRKLAEKISFTRYFGWINKVSPAPNVAEGCRDVLARKYRRSEFELKEASIERNFILQIVTPSINK